MHVDMFVVILGEIRPKAGKTPENNALGVTL